VDSGDRPLTAAAGPATAAQVLVAVAMVAMVAVTICLGLTSDHLQRPVAGTLYWSYLTAAPMLIGLYWCRRRPASRFGPLLVTMGVLGWMTSWQAANSPLAFDLGVLAEGPFFLLTFYLFLAFPMGRIEPRAARWLMGALVLGVLAFFLPWALFTPVIAGGGPLTGCAPGCPQNVLQIATAPRVVEVAGKAETYAALAITAAVFVVYLARLRSASQPQRRALMAVAVTSLLFLPAYFIHSFAASILKLDQATLDTLAWGIVGARILLPLGFLIALLQAELFAGRALRMLFERVAARPTPDQWRETIAEALDDPALRLGYRDPATKRFREPNGDELARAGAGRAWVPVDHDGAPVAAMVVDETLTADPELVRAAAVATLVAVENGALEGELRDSRARILEAGNAARRRIERDLHDSAQQRLIALRIGLTLAGDQVAGPRERAMIDRLGLEVDETIDELRDVAHGVYPQVLEQRGLAAALRAVGRRSALPVSVRDEGLARHSEALETSIYFSCVECLQNAAKHAGPGASATIRLAQENGHVTFSVEDDGAGFDPDVVKRGRGLTNIADRVAAVGGTVAVDARPGRGTRVSATLPASPQ
jgi:signal transduction histidine kinase